MNVNSLDEPPDTQMAPLYSESDCCNTVVPKYTECPTWILAVRMLLYRIQLLLTTDSIILILANTAQFVFYEVVDSRPRLTYDVT